MTKPTYESTVIEAFRRRLSDIRGVVGELDGILADGAGAIPPLILAQSLTSVDKIASDLANVAERIGCHFDPMRGGLADK